MHWMYLHELPKKFIVNNYEISKKLGKIGN